MTFQKLLIGVRFFTALSLVAWVSVLFLVDPNVAGVVGIALFLGTIFSFLTGSFTLVLVGLARRFLGETSASASFHVLFRQGFILSAFLVALLGLSRFGILSWWNAALGLAAALLIEFTVRKVSARA
ncbi:MAG: hypothetical protein WCJ25_05355 [Candidatus Moraniibacteriota bacterium]